MVYLGLYIIVFISGFYDFIKKHKDITIAITLVLFTILFLLSGFRYETGWDWPNYTALFDELPRNYSSLVRFLDNSGTSFERGFVLINYLVKLIGGNVQWVFALFAFVTIGLFITSLPKYTPYVFVTLLIYLFNIYYLNFSYIRQGLSLSIFFYTLRFIKEKNFKKYLLWNTISILFHSSTLIVLPLYFFLNKNIKGVYYALSIIVAFILMKVEWLEIFIQVLTGDNFFIQKFLFTANRFAEHGGAGISSRFLEFLIVFAFCAWNKDYFNAKFGYFNIILNCTFIYLIVYLLFNDLIIFVERIGILFIIGPTLLYGFILEKLKEISFKIVFYLFIALIILLRGISFFNMEGDTTGLSNKKQFLPYKNYLIEQLAY